MEPNAFWGSFAFAYAIWTTPVRSTRAGYEPIIACEIRMNLASAARQKPASCNAIISQLRHRMTILRTAVLEDFFDENIYNMQGSLCCIADGNVRSIICAGY
jgi:hypothetical protein